MHARTTSDPAVCKCVTEMTGWVKMVQQHAQLLTVQWYATGLRCTAMANLHCAVALVVFRLSINCYTVYSTSAYWRLSYCRLTFFNIPKCSTDVRDTKHKTQNPQQIDFAKINGATKSDQTFPIITNHAYYLSHQLCTCEVLKTFRWKAANT